VIEFRILGPLELKGSEGEDILSVLSQPKRVCVLAYLALTTFGGYTRRDILVGLFWPELDQERARGALRKTLYFLRKSLGEEVLSTRGEDEIALNWNSIHCDAIDFREMLKKGDLEVALEIYRGELLGGVFTSDCPEFEKWLDEERETLRELAGSTAWELGRRYLRTGRVTDGERMGQRALRLAPTDENEVRSFIRALNDAGDRAAALNFYEKFARILSEMLEVRPSPETREMVEQIRDTLEHPSPFESGGPSAPEASTREAASRPQPPPGPDSEPLPATDNQALNSRVTAALAHRYRVEHVLGHGGMATVFQAEDLKHRRKVALKVMDPVLAKAVGKERFLREIEIAANLTHPHILPLFDSGEIDGLLYYVMPFAEGESLRARIIREGQLPVAEALGIAREIALALDFAHGKGVVHRDVKPENILLEVGHAVLADFGVAQAVALAGSGNTTMPGMTVGTPAYMSPEQCTANPGLDGRSDQYGLACVLYEMLVGEEPFRGPTGENVVRQHLTRDPVPARKRRPSIPVHVSEALQKAMAKVPGDRFGSMTDFIRALGGAPIPHERGRPAHRSFGRLLPGLGLTAVCVSLAILFTRHNGGPPARPLSVAAPAVLAIMPFSVQGPEDLQWLSEGMATLLGTRLDEVGNVRTVDRNALLPHLGRLGPGERLSLAEAQESARHFGATHFVLGEGIGSATGRFTLVITLYPVEDSAEGNLPVRLEGSSDDPYRLADSLVGPLLSPLQIASGQRLSGVAALTTDSISALRHYLEGEESFRSTRYAEAYEAFQRAVEVDPTFALAHYRRSVAAVLDLKFDQAHLAADRARAFSARLTRRDRQLLDAWAAFLEGSADRAQRLYGDILEDYPEEVEAHFGMGAVLVYFNSIRGLPIAEAEPEFRRVLQLMPNFGEARFHLLEFATQRRDRSAFDSLFSLVDPESDQALAWTAVHAFAWGDMEARRRVEARIQTADPVEAGLAVARVAAYLQDYAAAERLANLLTGPGQDSPTQCAATILMAMTRFARGRWSDGMASMDAVDACNDAWATELRALFTGFPLRPPAPDEVTSIQNRLATWRADQVSLSTNFVFFAHNGQHPALRHFLLALTSVWADELEDADRYADSLRMGARSQEQRAITAAWAQSIQARIAAARGRSTEAVELLGASRADVPPELVAISPFFSRSFDRFLLGELLRGLGRDQEALNWFKTLTEGHELILVAPAHLRIAQILEAGGHPVDAAAHYKRFAELWEGADPVFQPLVQEARTRSSILSNPA